MSLRDNIARQAMTLPPEDRAFVADLLEGSLPAGEFSDGEVAASWSREIDRRIQAYDRGETTAIELDVAIDQMRRSLAGHGAVESE